MTEYDFNFIAGLAFAILAMYIICIVIGIVCLVVSIRAMIKLKKNTDESKRALYRGLSLLILVPIGVIIYFIGQFLPIYLKQKQNNEYLANIPHIKVIDKEDAWINGFDLDNKHIVYVESQSWNTNYKDTKNKVSTKPYFDSIEFDGYIDYNGNIADVNNRKPYAILECNGKEYEIWKLNTTSEYNIYNIDTLNLPNTALGIHGSYFIDSQFITDFNINYDDMLINLYNYKYIESTTEEPIIEDDMNTDLPEIELATAGDTDAKNIAVEESIIEENIDVYTLSDLDHYWEYGLTYEGTTYRNVKWITTYENGELVTKLLRIDTNELYSWSYTDSISPSINPKFTLRLDEGDINVYPNSDTQESNCPYEILWIKSLNKKSYDETRYFIDEAFFTKSNYIGIYEQSDVSEE